ncbi:hypothetical protein [uncultured Aquimarina sp.]|uniref:hypothetical protein n=1 Tax=uncultured Aquimarina sp. TaxID=575652 RepID=UPI00262EE06A|nr:hypothetical protein [uncultured Aquimarina sp.]
MKKKNIKDDILRALVSEKIPVLPPEELLAKVNYEKSIFDFAILELEKANQLAILKPRTKDDNLKYTLTQDGEIFIRNTSYYEQHKKGKTNSFYKIADKSIAILGILTGIIFGINSCSSENKNDRLIKLVEQKDSILNQRVTEYKTLELKIDSVSYEMKVLKEKFAKLNKNKTETKIGKK